MSLLKLFIVKPYKMVLVVRSDLNMKTGKVASQCAHAAVMLYMQGSKIDLFKWKMMGQPKIVVQTENENSLLTLHKAAKAEGLNTALVRDAGRTQVATGTLTVLGIGPDIADNIDNVTKHLKLL